MLINANLKGKLEFGMILEQEAQGKRTSSRLYSTDLRSTDTSLYEISFQMIHQPIAHIYKKKNWEKRTNKCSRREKKRKIYMYYLGNSSLNPLEIGCKLLSPYI